MQTALFVLIVHVASIVTQKTERAEYVNDDDIMYREALKYFKYLLNEPYIK